MSGGTCCLPLPQNGPYRQVWTSWWSGGSGHSSSIPHFFLTWHLSADPCTTLLPPRAPTLPEKHQLQFGSFSPTHASCAFPPKSGSTGRLQHPHPLWTKSSRLLLPPSSGCSVRTAACTCNPGLRWAGRVALLQGGTKGVAKAGAAGSL